MERLNREGVALAYVEAGSGAPPILLVHDLDSDHTCFVSQFEHFSRRHRVVAADLRGHGESDKPAGTYTVSLLADDLAWLCYELGLYRPVLIGYGFGAIIALDLAERYQDLPTAIVVASAETGWDSIQIPATQPTVPLKATALLLGGNSAWDLVAVTALSGVPVVYVALASREAVSGPRPDAGSYPAALSCHSGQACERTPSREINLLVDEFLSKLVGRAPP